ncbi:TPA: hypothetical protein ACH3X2_008004 [Trebouxia sp. C0005]
MLVQVQALHQPSKQLPQSEALKQLTVLQKTSSQIPAENTQNSLNPNAAAFEPNQPSKVSSRLSLGNAHSSQKVTSSSQALATSKAPDMSALKASSATAPESKNGSDRSCVIGLSEPK